MRQTLFALSLCGGLALGCKGIGTNSEVSEESGKVEVKTFFREIGKSTTAFVMQLISNRGVEEIYVSSLLPIRQSVIIPGGRADNLPLNYEQARFACELMNNTTASNERSSEFQEFEWRLPTAEDLKKLATNNFYGLATSSPSRGLFFWKAFQDLNYDYQLLNELNRNQNLIFWADDSANAKASIRPAVHLQSAAVLQRSAQLVQPYLCVLKPMEEGRPRITVITPTTKGVPLKKQANCEIAWYNSYAQTIDFRVPAELGTFEAKAKFTILNDANTQSIPATKVILRRSCPDGYGSKRTDYSEVDLRNNEDALDTDYLNITIPDTKPL